LYYKTGNIISEKIASEKWGSKTIEKLSVDLQYELKGLRGFSATNLKRMKRFYEVWFKYFQSFISSNDISFFEENKFEINGNTISSLVTDELGDDYNKSNILLFSQYGLMLVSLLIMR